MKLQSAIHMLFPPRCLNCGDETASDFVLCAPCWRDTPFVSGQICDLCGMPLPGGLATEIAHCDSCLIAPKPWRRGRAALLYDGTARRLVLRLKYGDRLDLAPALAGWMADAGRELALAQSLCVPVPLHWRRLFNRRYNQAALLAEALAKRTGAAYCPDLLRRLRATKKQEGMRRAERQENQRDAFGVTTRHRAKLAQRRVVLVDDVMTSGATLASCAETCLAAGAIEVNVLVLARVARET